MSRELRTLAVGAVAILLILALGRGLPRLLELERTSSATASRLENALQDEMDLLADASTQLAVTSYSADLAALRNRLVRASSPLAAASLVQRNAAAAARQAGIELTGSSAEATPEFLNRIDTVSVRLTAVGSAHQLTNWLALLSPESALVRVRELAVIPFDVHLAPGDLGLVQISVLVEALAGAETGGEANR